MLKMMLRTHVHLYILLTICYGNLSTVADDHLTAKQLIIFSYANCKCLHCIAMTNRLLKFKKEASKNKLKVKVRRNCHALVEAALSAATRKLINVKAYERDGVITSSQQQQRLSPLQQQQQISCSYKVDKM